MGFLVVVVVCVALSPGASAAPRPDLSTPVSFFTNVANYLLRSELGVSSDHISVYPTNNYTPAVHRLLQLSANLYDATTNRTETGYPYLPSVFRPVFASSSNEVYIAGYEEVTNTDVLTVPYRDLSDAPHRLALAPPDMVVGIPLIIGAKKGFPSFNEFALQQDLTVARRMTLHRPSPGMPVTTTNQMYVLGASNFFGFNAWNSYSSNFPRALSVEATIEVRNTVTDRQGNPIAARNGSTLTNGAILTVSTNLSSWPAYRGSASAFGFFTSPLVHNLWLTNSAYSFALNQFLAPGPTNSDPANFFPIPDWVVNLGVQVRCAIVDTTANRIVDFVSLTSKEPPIDVTSRLFSDVTCASQVPSRGDFFCTNGVGGSSAPYALPFGLAQQFNVSAGIVQISDTQWRSWNADANDKIASIVSFNQFLANNTTLAMQAPFSPYRVIHQHVLWAANDPLVHYQTNDLLDSFYPVGTTLDASDLDNSFSDLGSPSPLQAHYRPWGGNPKKFSDTTPPAARIRSIKDPFVTRSDNWSFPSNLLADLSQLGQVHRGTPWQTLYLKSESSDPLTWQMWTGDTNATDAAVLHPTNDWGIATLLLNLFRTTSPTELRASNPPASSGWASLLEGITVYTNGVPPAAQFTMTSNSPQAVALSQALSSAQTSRQWFSDPSEVVSVPELSVTSPWLNSSTSVSDLAYEAIPSQLLLRLRKDSIARVIGPSPAHIQFTGVDFYNYAIERSTDLANWITVATNSPTGGILDFTDSTAPSTEQIYYRTGLLP